MGRGPTDIFEHTHSHGPKSRAILITTVIRQTFNKFRAKINVRHYTERSGVNMKVAHLNRKK